MLTMKNRSTIIRYIAIPALYLGLVGMANASEYEKGYAMDSQDVVVKDNYDDCVRSASPGSDIPLACGGVVAEPAPRVVRAMPAPAPAPAPVSKTVLEGKALFASDKSALKPAGRASLEKLAREIESTPGVQEIRVVGYADSTGAAVYNQNLSERRAITVKNYLESRGLSNISAEGRGSNDPVASNDTSEGRAHNRRVEIEVIAQ
jgi:OOP family OmpA-OmpF porin